MVESEIRSTAGVYTPVANQVATEVRDFTEALIERYKDQLSADIISHIVATTAYETIIMHIAFNSFKS